MQRFTPPQRVGHWPVSRGWPRALDHALLELQSPDGPRGAQWWAQPERAHQAARDLPGTRVVDGVLIHPADSDAALPAFAQHIDAGDRLIAHRPGRRAVFRPDRPQAAFTKVTRRRRAADAVDRHRAVESVAAGLRIADVLDHGKDWIQFSVLTGRTLLDLGKDATVSDAELAGAWHALGRGLASLHAATPGHASSLTHTHDANAEADTTRSWLAPVMHWGALPQVSEREIERALASLAGEPATAPGLLHRDLHDQQVLIDGDHGSAGLLDLDTAAWGEPALDVANVLAHLDLRVRQDALTPWRAHAARSAFLGALAPKAATRARVPAYRRATQLRLAAVYALRPRWHGVAQELFHEALRGD